MIKLLIYTTVYGMLLLCSCNFRDINDPRLITVDSLMNHSSDSAYSILKGIEPTSLRGKANKAYYALLYTQAQYKNADSIHTDSLINIAVAHYNDNHDIEKHTQALIYKGAALSDMGDTRNAMEWYKKAEENADKTDYMNLGQINMRMAALYKDAYIGNNIEMDKYKKALYFYNRAKSENSILDCLTLIGAQYRAVNTDSAYYYLNSAVQLARVMGDSASVSKNLSFLAGAYYTDSLYYKAKETAISVINSKAEYTYKNDCYNFASRAYANMGMVDSAEYYIKFQETNLSPKNEISLLISLREIEKAKGNYKKVHEYDTRRFKITDSLMQSSARNALFSIEKRYDKRTVELENLELTKKNERKYFVITSISLILIIVIISFWLINIKKKKQIDDSIQLVEKLKRESLESKNTLISKLDNQSKLKEALEHQIKTIKQLIEHSYRCGNNSDKFMSIFKNSVRLNKLTNGFWKDIRYFVDENYYNILTRLATQYPTLTEDELNFIGLICCDFSYLEITVCMGYTNEHSTCNKRWRIAKKMNIDGLLDDYLHELIEEDRNQASHAE